jgi:hypothetical protein
MTQEASVVSHAAPRRSPVLRLGSPEDTDGSLHGPTMSKGSQLAGTHDADSVYGLRSQPSEGDAHSAVCFHTSLDCSVSSLCD